MANPNYDQDAVWYGMYFLVAFFVIRYFVAYFKLSYDELNITLYAALFSIPVAAVYYFMREKLVINKLIPIILVVILGIVVFFLLP